MSMKQVIIALIVSLFPAMMLAVPVQAEAISSQSEQPVEVEERWNLATKNMLEKKYAEAIPILHEYVEGDIVYSMAAKVKLGEVYFAQGLNENGIIKADKLKQSYKWNRDAYTQGMALGFLPQEDGSLENGFLPHRLGYLCELGAGNEQIDSPIDSSTCAVHWYKLAAEEGRGLSMARLGYIYSDGLYGTERAPELAYNYFRSALVQPEFQETELLPETSLAIAMLIIDSRWSAEPNKNAVPHLKVAADGGIPYAKYILGILYERGLFGVSKDPKQAATLKAEARLSLPSGAITILERLIDTRTLSGEQNEK